MAAKPCRTAFDSASILSSIVTGRLSSACSSAIVSAFCESSIVAGRTIAGSVPREIIRGMLEVLDRACRCTQRLRALCSRQIADLSVFPFVQDDGIVVIRGVAT